MHLACTSQIDIMEFETNTMKRFGPPYVPVDIIQLRHFVLDGKSCVGRRTFTVALLNSASKNEILLVSVCYV